MSRIRGAALIGLVAVLAVYAAAAVSAQHMGMGMGMGGPSPEHLGRMLFFDSNLSANGNQSCSSCHDASTGFTGPQSTINALDVVYEGSIAGRFGNRKPQSAAYAMLAPRFDYDADRGFSGGNFWDGRATGWQLGSAVADQAQAPFLNPLEHGLADPAEVVARVCAAHYGRMLRRVWGASVCSDVDLGFAAIAQSLAAFESSVAVSPFSSKYDVVLSGQAELTAREQQGLELFEGKARCASCHDGVPTSPGRDLAFSDFRYHNIGVPRNPENPFYRMDRVVIDGEVVNSQGAAWIDPGLAGFLLQLASDGAWRSAPHVTATVSRLTSEQLARLAQENLGKHRVPTLRNVDLRPSPDFTKAYTHNGYFKTLRGLVHFLNTRDVLPRCTTPMTEAEALANDCWPAPEVSANLDTRDTGNLQLTADEEAALVAFLETLSDGFGGGEAMGGHAPGSGCGMMSR